MLSSFDIYFYGSYKKGIWLLKVKVTPSYRTLCDPMDYTVYGILRARILEYVPFPFSKESSPTQGSNQGLLLCRLIFFTS